MFNRDYDYVEEECEKFVGEMVEDSNSDGAVIGLSGGIDSSTVATLSSNLGVDVKGLIMPSSVTPDEHVEDAKELAEENGIEYELFDIDSICKEFLEKYESDDRMAIGNVQVRTRAVLNYLVANTENRIVLGTGNKSEALCGYYTKYGDQAVDCNPIGGLYKTEVRELAKHINVKESIINREPSAGMWEGQSDEEEMGLPYEYLDEILYYLFDEEMSKQKITDEKDIKIGDVEKVLELHDSSEHKRNMPPSPSF